MFKIRRIRFQDHPILGDLSLDFCDRQGEAADTVILAGENGTGKSTVLNGLYEIVSRTLNFSAELELETPAGVRRLTYQTERLATGAAVVRVSDGQGLNETIESFYRKVEKAYPTCGIFSDVDINFHAQELKSATSMALDREGKSRRSGSNLPTEINQLLIDIQASDDGDFARAARRDPDRPANQLAVPQRMPRFTAAFNRMFEQLTYSHVENRGGHKSIIFQKNGLEIPIDGLSSGEKQIVYRGCFLLRDANAINGAFVFIDEPEISLHPNWQKKIMDYYKGIFTDQAGKQTSQIFAVTHSPFVIHNENRRRDKVLVLTRDEQGRIAVKDRPEYFKCTSVEAVEDAFSLTDLSPEQSTVYLEGRTDERYFNRAAEVYGCDLPFRFKWVGYLDERGQEVHTGDKSLHQAFHFLVAQDLPVKNFCLLDCDTDQRQVTEKRVTMLSLPRYENSKGIKKGIENALILDRVDMTPYYRIKEGVGDYGEPRSNGDFQKMPFCEAVCRMEDEPLREIFAHLKEVIDRLEALYRG